MIGYHDFLKKLYIRCITDFIFAYMLYLHFSRTGIMDELFVPPTPNSYVEVLTPEWWYLEMGPLRGRVRWGHKGGLFTMGPVPL